MNVGMYVYCRTSFIGFHCWPDAPEKIKYLRNYHRHVFHVKVTVKVRHDNREVEFITLKEHVDKLIKSLGFDTYVSVDDKTKSRSCEMMAEVLASRLLDGSYKVVEVEISEDEENGAIYVNQ